MMSTEIRTRPRFTAESPQVLFTIEDIGTELIRAVFNHTYEVTHDGNGFIIVRDVRGRDQGAHATVVQNWYAEFKDR